MQRDADQTPRLANDTIRSYLSVGLSIVLSFVVGVVFALVSASLDAPPDRRTLSIGTGLFVFGGYFLIYAVSTWATFRRADSEQLIRWTKASTPRSRNQRLVQWLLGAGVRSWAISAALSALVAVIAVAVFADLRDNAGVVVGSLFVVATGWLLIVYAYAVAYLRENVARGGLGFPADPPLVWSDYFYLAIQVSTTFSSSDVEIRSSSMRRLITGQSIIAFVFNTGIVALLVSSLLLGVS